MRWAEQGVLLVRGAVPGPKGGLLPARAVTTYPVTLLADVAA